MIVEDGTGIDGANSYVTQAQVIAYLEARGKEWIPNDGEIVRASQWIDIAYQWPGRRKTLDQGLSWPRTDAYDREGFELLEVPRQVKDAVCEAVLFASDLGAPLERGGQIASVKVGPVSESYFQGASPGTVYPVIDKILYSIVGGGGRVVVTR